MKWWRGCEIFVLILLKRLLIARHELPQKRAGMRAGGRRASAGRQTPRACGLEGGRTKRARGPADAAGAGGWADARTEVQDRQGAFDSFILGRAQFSL